MTQDQFYKWMEDPSLMNGASIPEIREVIKRYPYFQGAQIMLAKNLKQEDHIDQLNQQQLAAVMVPNRKVLHAYLHGKVAMEAISVDHSTGLSSENEGLKTEETGLTPDSIERSSLYDLIPEPIVYRLETADLPELILPSLKAQAETLQVPESLTFSEWLEFVQKEDHHREMKTDRLEPATPLTTRSKIDIIDHFLTQQSSGVKKRAEFFNPQKVGAKSTLEDFSVVSETLARIYFEQEKYELARQAYQALGLKYPEKSIYFAARLKEIDEKLNTEN